MSKSVLQKAYEKLSMVEHNVDKLVLVGAETSNGRPMVVLALREDDVVTPIAEILTKAQADLLEPDWEYTEKIWDVIEGAKAIDDRMFIQSFQGQYPKVDNYFEGADY